MLETNKPGLLLPSLFLALGACAAKPAVLPERRSDDRAAQREAGSANDALSISGLRGTLSQEEIKGALEPRLPKFVRCASARLGELDVLSGSLTFSFHVAVNGSVAAVSPSQSTLGDRATERCMLEVASAVHFPAPHGGEADFTWPLELPLDAEVRAPVELASAFAEPVSSPTSDGARPRDTLLGSCGGTQYVVTAYVDPSGQVLASGVATPDPVTTAELDCVAAGVKGWSFASPGSYLGKVSFTIP